MTDRYNGLVRLLQMIELLKREPWHVSALAAELEITRRTVYRYLHVIDRAGALQLTWLGWLKQSSVDTDDHHRVYYRISHDPKA
jgi:predicted DNA-binding transcriptional regulator YafY